MVVVGNAGRLKRWCCMLGALRKRAVAAAHRVIDGGERAARPSHRESAGEVLRAAAAASDALSAASTLIAAARRAPSPSAASSSIFCTENASQLFTSGSSSVSRARSIGTCSSEQDGAICTRSLPSLATTGSSRSSSAAQIGAPDIAAVDHAERQHAILRQLGEIVELLGRAHEIEMQARDRKRQRGVEVVAEPAEIGCQHDLESAAPPWRLPHRPDAAPAARRRRDRARDTARRSAPIPRRLWRARAGLRCRPAAAGRAATADRSRRPCSWRASGR